MDLTLYTPISYDRYAMKRTILLLPFAAALLAQTPPTLSLLSPNAVPAGSGVFTLTVTGTSMGGATVQWTAGSVTTPLSTSTISATQVDAIVPAALVAAAGSATISANGSNGTPSTNSLPFTINPPVLTSLAPSFATAGTFQVSLTVNGSNFTSVFAAAPVNSTIYFGGTALPTLFVNGNQLTADVPFNLLTTPGIVGVTVQNPGGSTSNTLPFTILAPPVITGTNPTFRTEGNGPFTLQILGANYVNGATVWWDGDFQLGTSFVNGGRLDAAVPPNLLFAGTHQIQVSSPDFVYSNQIVFTVNPAPTATSLSPLSRTATAPAFTLTVNGTNFLNGPTVRWNGTILVTTVVNPTQVTATVPASLITSAGSANVTVWSGDGVSSSPPPLTFTINPAPAISTLTPNSVTAGHAAFTLTVAGTNFPAGAIVRWNGVNQATTLLTGGLTVTIPASLVASAGTANVTVLTPDGAVSGPAVFTIAAAPAITSLNPPLQVAGSPGFTLAVNGANFVSGMTVQWNGLPLATTFVNATQLTAPVAAGLIASAGSAAVTVLTADGVSSASAPFIIAIQPSITSLTPPGAAAGAAAFTLTVDGSNFANGMTVNWNGSPLATTFVTATRLTAAVPAGLIASPGTASITVATPSGVVSNAVAFPIVANPTISSLSPASRTAGAAAFTLTVNGANFTTGMTVNWNGSPLPSTFVNNSQMTATVTAALIATAGAAAITVGGQVGLSAPATFTIVPAPTITSLNPSSRTAGAPAFTLTVNGANFAAGALVRWNGVALVTTYVSAAQLTAAVPAALVAAPGNAAVTVMSSDVVLSAPATFTVLSLPSISSLNPANRVAGTAAFSLTVNGANFAAGATVLWNGAPLATTFVNPAQLTASVPANLIASPGTASVAVSSADGLAGAAAVFTIIPLLRITTVLLSEASPQAPYDTTLTAIGGLPPYTWSAIGLPTGLTLNASTGRITGTPLADTTTIVSVTVNDTGGQTANAQFTLRVKTPIPPLFITTSSLPAGVATEAYGASIGASGGRPDYSFSIAGGSLPSGLSLSSSGGLGGTPTTAGTYSFTVRVTDTSGGTATRDFQLVIAAPPLVITTSSLPDSPAGTPLSLKFGATGGVPPYRFSASGVLPPGLSLATDGTLSGTPNTRGTFPFRVGVTDSANTQTTKDFSIVITTPALVITTASPLADGQVGEAYAASFAAAGGVAPYAWAASGLPDGLSLSSAGALSGTPTVEGSSSIAVTVTDATGGKATKNFSLTVASAKLLVTTKSLPDGVVGTSYSATLAASGGTKPYSWSAGGLPDGISVSSSGSLSGTPGTAGSFTVSVTVTDAAGAKATASFQIKIEAAPLLITTRSLPDGVVGSAYSASLAAIGGTAPYAWSGSNLPAGLAVTAGGAVTGTPAAGGTFPFTVIVTDSAGQSTTGSFSLTVTVPPAPPLNFGGTSGSANPGSQTRIQVTLGSPYPTTIVVVLTLTFAADTGPDDPAVQFATGGRTARVVIPAGQTVGATDVGLQVGTVAGVITITTQLQTDSGDITPTPVPKQIIQVVATAPVLSSVTATRASTGFAVTIVGFSPTREVAQAVFRFSGPAGSTLQTTSVTIPVDTLFSGFYQSPAAAPFGSQFTFTQTFTIQGDPLAITSITVTLSNKVGTSAAITANLN